MTSHVHYDVDAAIRAMEADCAAVVLPEGAKRFYHVLLRQRKAQHALFRAILEEENAGTPLGEQMAMVAHYVAELVLNTSKTLPGDNVQRFMSLFINDLLKAYEIISDDADARDTVTTTRIPSTAGGRA